MDIQNGYLFITDMTGYTLFLTRSELDHAKENPGRALRLHFAPAHPAHRHLLPRGGLRLVA